MDSTLFVGKPEGGQQCDFDFFSLLFRGWDQYKHEGLRGTRGRITPQPPINRALFMGENQGEFGGGFYAMKHN